MDFRFSVNPNWDRRCVQFATTVVIKPRHVMFLVRREGGNVTVDTRQGRRLNMVFDVGDDVTSRGDGEHLARVVREKFRSGLLSSAHLLYEFDPRMGWRWEGTKSRMELPVSRLFDPPEPFSRSGVPLILDREVGGYRSNAFDAPKCPFCREAHDFSDPPLWAGANLMWVHVKCWRLS
jgi:hypothetical protein